MSLQALIEKNVFRKSFSQVEVAAGVLGEAPTEERLRAALPARVLAEPTLGGTVALEDSSPVFAHLKLLPVLCFAHLPRRP